jgi:hypothetical protein
MSQAETVGRLFHLELVAYEDDKKADCKSIYIVSICIYNSLQQAKGV